MRFYNSNSFEKRVVEWYDTGAQDILKAWAIANLSTIPVNFFGKTRS